MRANLAAREKLFGQLFPRDHANYGMDDSWIRCYPYEQNIVAGEQLTLDVVVTNHSTVPQTLSCRVVPPQALHGRNPEWASIEVKPKSEAAARLMLALPAGIAPGRYVTPTDIRYGDRDLPQFTEAVLAV